MTAHEYIEKFNELIPFKEYMVYPRSQPIEYKIPIEDEIINLIKYYDVTRSEYRASGRHLNFLFNIVYGTEIECIIFIPKIIIYYSILVNGGIPIANYLGDETMVVNVKTKEIELWKNETIGPLHKANITRCALNGEKMLDALYRFFFEDVEFTKNYSGNPKKYGKKLCTHMVNHIPVFAKLAGGEDYRKFWEYCVELRQFEMSTLKKN